MELFEAIFDDIHGRCETNAKAAEKPITSFRAKTNIHAHKIICFFFVFHIFHSSSHFNAFHPLPFAVTLSRLDSVPFACRLFFIFLFRFFSVFSVFLVFSGFGRLCCACVRSKCAHKYCSRSLFFYFSSCRCTHAHNRFFALRLCTQQINQQAKATPR